ncbi:MAG: SPOR domain-containing protein [Vicinamibacterales bacterium]
MSDQDYREIQLSGKQLVFVFGCALGLAVVVFLLGVYVGRGVADPMAVSASAGTTGSTVVPVAEPDPSTANLEPDYHDALKTGGAGGAGGQTPPASGATSTPPAATPAPAESTPPPTPPATSEGARNPSTGEVPPITPPNTPAPKAAASAGQPDPPRPATGGFDVQVGAYNSKANVDALVKRLKDRGFAAYVVPGQPGQPSFIVRVGPYGTRADAEKAAATIGQQERNKPSVISR